MYLKDYLHRLCNHETSDIVLGKRNKVVYMAQAYERHDITDEVKAMLKPSLPGLKGS